MIPFVMIELDKPRKLRFGMSAVVEFEQITGIKITDLDEESMSGSLCAKLLWIMLKQDDPAIGLPDVCKLIDDNCDSLVTVMEKVGEAIRAAFEVKGGEKNARKAKASS